MKKIPIRDHGLIGTLFTKGTPSSAVIVLGGSSGGLNETRAEKLAEHGFATLALAYFAVDSLPATLRQIPLEYFETAIQRLRKEPNICKVGLWGGSRGAELSLILGSIFPDQIDAIAAHVPSSVVYGTFDRENAAAWLYKKKPIAPNAPFSFDPNLASLSKEIPVAATPFFLNSMKNSQVFKASAIPVEKILCPLLLISAEDDQMWPSTLFAGQILDRLREYRSTIDCSHIHYPGVGHAPGKGEAGFHPILGRWFAYGGNPAKNALAAEDWVRQTVRFFKKSL